MIHKTNQISNGVKLSVIVPAYNEEKRLPKTLREIYKYLSTRAIAKGEDERSSSTTQSYDSEIIVVSDGSKDRTVEVVKEMMPTIKNLRVIDEKENYGKGYAVRQGMLKAKGDYRLFTDADNSTSIDQVEKMWPEFERGYDIISGSRDIKGAVLDPPQSWWRMRIGDIFNLFVQAIVGLWGIWDTQCGFKGFTKKSVEDVFPRCKINRFAFDPEILVIAKKLGYKIKEIPVIWKNDPESKVKFKNMVKMGIDLLKVRWNLVTKKYTKKHVQ